MNLVVILGFLSCIVATHAFTAQSDTSVNGASSANLRKRARRLNGTRNDDDSPNDEADSAIVINEFAEVGTFAVQFVGCGSDGGPVASPVPAPVSSPVPVPAPVEGTHGVVPVAESSGTPPPVDSADSPANLVTIKVCSSHLTGCEMRTMNVGAYMQWALALTGTPRRKYCQD